jgi:hypothetical protein
VDSNLELRAFTSRATDGILAITIEREFDFGNLHQDWAQSIITRHPGPFQEVRVDMTKCGRVSSTFYAGLMQLHFAFNTSGTRPLVLIKPDPRMLANLRILHLEQYFHIVP